MHTLSIDEIRALPEYRELLHKRRKIGIPLCVIMLLAYYAFIFTVAYEPAVLSQRMSDGVTTLGIWVGLGLILLTWAVTAFYVWYVNSHLEDLINRIQAKAALR